jgi:hypothetical protein
MTQNYHLKNEPNLLFCPSPPISSTIKSREPARVIIATGNERDDRWHLQIAQRWVVQYNFYMNDERWGRMFVRMCPVPALLRSCLPEPELLAGRPNEQGRDRFSTVHQRLSEMC